MLSASYMKQMEMIACNDPDHVSSVQEQEMEALSSKILDDITITRKKGSL